MGLVHLGGARFPLSERPMSHPLVAAMAPRLVGVVVMWAGTVLAVMIGG